AVVHTPRAPGCAVEPHSIIELDPSEDLESQRFTGPMQQGCYECGRGRCLFELSDVSRKDRSREGFVPPRLGLDVPTGDVEEPRANVAQRLPAPWFSDETGHPGAGCRG